MSLHRRVLHKEPEDDEAWLMTYADMVTLLLCFFIILFAMSSPDSKKFSNMSRDLQESGFLSAMMPAEDPYEELKEQLEMSLGASGYDQFIAVNQTPKFVSVELSSHSFFEPGTTKFKPEALPMLQLITKQLLPLKEKKITIEIEGHTDDSPINSERFPSNWELSSARASAVVRYLIEQGFPREKLRAIGYADTRPKAPNRDTVGNSILANQELNRRVIVKMLKADESE
jgi:chemotaxis protein MotB